MGILFQNKFLKAKLLNKSVCAFYFLILTTVIQKGYTSLYSHHSEWKCLLPHTLFNIGHYHWTLLPSPVTSTTGCCFCFGSVSSFFLELFLHWSPVAYWAPTSLRISFSVSYLSAFSYCSWGSQGKNTEVVCHSLLQWTTFGQNSPPWSLVLSDPTWHGS